MALNNNAQFYKKLLEKISLLFCLFFLLIANVMRFNQLDDAKEIKPALINEKPKFVSFVDFRDKNSQSKILFLETSLKQKELSMILSKEQPKSLFFINCASDKNNHLQTFLENNFSVTEISCDATKEELTSYLEEEALIVLFLDSIDLPPIEVLRTAEKSGLKPSVHMMEIKNANKRI